MSEWYYAHDGEQKGPVPVSELHRLAANGDFDPVNDLVWREGMSDWKPAGTVPELAPSKPAETAPGAPSPESSGSPGPGSEPAPYTPPASTTATPASTTAGAPTGGPPSAGLAIASMICGIIALLTFCIWCLALPLGLTAVILGHLALSKAKKTPDRFGGKGMAGAGLATGYLALLLSVAITAWAATLTPEKLEQMDWIPEDKKQELLEQLEMRERLREGSGNIGEP